MPVAPIPTVLTQSELERIRASTQPPPITDFESHRLELKKLSDSRVKNWKNTLSATREKKLQWKAEKIAQQEKERQIRDREEAELRHKERLEALRRANSLLNEQTDLMKNFRSAQLYSEVLHARTRQAEERKKREHVEKERDSVYHEMMLVTMEEYDKKERDAEASVKQRYKDVARMQKEQRAKVEARKAAQRQAEVVEGQEILDRSRAEIEEDRQKAWERKMWHRKNNEAMTQANARLKVLRAEHAKKEAEDDAKIEAVVKQKEATARARKQFEQDRFESKQIMRKMMIQRAVEAMSKFVNNEAARQEKQAQELRDKEDADLARRADLRRRQQEAIDYSRALQRRLRAEKAEADKELNRRQAEVWAKRNAELDREEREKEEMRFRKNMEVRLFLDEQSKILEKRREEERAQWRLGQAMGSAIRLEDRDRFEAYAVKEIEKAKKQGKPLHPLLCALHYKQEPLLPCKINKKARRDNNQGKAEA